MTIIDAFIIYLTLGAPIAMYRFSSADKRFGIDPVLKAVAALLFWPLYLAQIIRNAELSGSDRHLNANKRQFLTTDIRTAEKSVAKAISKAVNVYAPSEYKKLLAETAERYAGLKLAESNSNNDPVFRDIFEISDHPNPKLAAVCLSRKNQLRLKKHISIAENDLINAIKLSAFESNKPLYVINMAARIAAVFGDSQLSHLIRSKLVVPQQPAFSTSTDHINVL